MTDATLAEKIGAFKKSGGNLSRLIQRLLAHYFSDNGSTAEISRDLIFILDIKEKIEEFENWRREILPKLEFFERKLKEEEKQRDKNQNELIKLLKEKYFEDLVQEGYEKFESRCVTSCGDAESAIEIRLSAFAADCGLTLPQAKKLFLRAFPELDGKIKF